MQITQLDALTYVGPQISLSDIAELKRRGICKIIVTRPEGEADDQPAISEITRAAKAVGIEVLQIPVVSGQITDEDVSAFGACAAQTSGPIFAYCRSGMRATSLWAIDKCNRGQCVDTILRDAQTAGFDLSPLLPRLVTKPSTTA
ncbi:MAG: TIGR01244 family phosphatase [Yoonia sp.]|nr:TIGR01244 family phosphatase [Yoonia sp.]